MRRVNVSRRHDIEIVGFEDLEYYFVKVVFSGIELSSGAHTYHSASQ